MIAKVTFRDTARGSLKELSIFTDVNSPEYIIHRFCNINKLPWWTYILRIDCEDKTYVWKAIAEKAGVKR